MGYLTADARGENSSGLDCRQRGKGTVNLLAASSCAAWSGQQAEPCHAAAVMPLTSAQISKARVLASILAGGDVIATEVEQGVDRLVG